jgi:hypothetical protein
MADRIGLFASPEEVRNARIDEIRQRQMESAPKGFNFGMSLGQGMRESANNILGITNPMEAKAAELQAMMQSIDPNSPDDLANIAKMMNELGYTKEAIALLERRNAVVNQQNKEQEATTKKAQGDTRTVQKVVMRPMQIGSGKDAKVVQVPTQVSITQEWKNGAWVDIVPDTASTAADGKYGGITVIDPKTGMTTLKQGDPAVDGFTEDLTISP